MVIEKDILNILRSHGWTLPYALLFFYPKDDTPNCTQQCIAFSNHHMLLQANGINAFGISPDTKKSHQDFAEKYQLNVPLIDDSESRLENAFGVKRIEWNGVMYLERSSFLLSSNGLVLQEWRGVKPEGHVEEVIQAFKILQASVL